MHHEIEVIGNLGRDPELRYMPNGNAVCNMNVASNRKWTQDGEKKSETSWFRVSVFGKQAEACNQYLRKGSKVFLKGRMSADSATGGPRIWTGSDGVAKASFEITAQSVVFLSSKAEDQGIQQATQGGYGQDVTAPPADDDIPF